MNNQEHGRSPEPDTSARRILSAARTLFARHGFKGTTTRAIAKAASVNEVTIFRTWGTKEAILGEILAAGFPDEENAPLARLLDTEVHSLEELETLLAGFMETFSAQILPSIDDLLQIVLKESGERPDYLDFFVARANSLTDLLAARLQALEGSLVQPGCSRTAAESILYMLIGRFLLSRHPGAEQPDLHAFAGMFARGMADPCHVDAGSRDRREMSLISFDLDCC